MGAGHFSLSPAARAVVADLGVPLAEVLRVAGLDTDLFSRQPVSLTPAQYYALWRALEEVTQDPVLPVTLSSLIRPETFDPALFAALCSPDLRSAAERIAVHKRLLGPMRLRIDDTAAGMRLTVQWPPGEAAPPVLVATELLFWVHLARTGTRTRVVPERLTMPHAPQHEQYVELLGVAIEEGRDTTVTFTPLESRRPFLTADESVWQALEPMLRRRMAELDNGHTTTGRVQALLLELLPAASGTVTGVARRLGLSSRTLQRRLHEEGQSFQSVLDGTRESLAQHYLADPGLPVAEIAFLLGYDDPNSFYRAFQAWTGTTPREARGSEPPETSETSA